jgi:hypothetical protein
LVAEWALPLAVMFLSRKTILSLISAVLLEKKVAIVASTPRVVSSVVYVPFVLPSLQLQRENSDGYRDGQVQIQVTGTAQYLCSLLFLQPRVHPPHPTLHIPVLLHTDPAVEDALVPRGSRSVPGTLLGISSLFPRPPKPQMQFQRDTQCVLLFVLTNVWRLG